MELRDSYKRKINYLRFAITDRCNLRCIYCIPYHGIEWKRHEEILSYEEIERLAKIALGMGISRIRLTGGEPLLRRDLPSLIASLNSLPGIEDLSLTTNGILLKDYIDELWEAGLRRINISLDSLNPEVYKRITRGGSLSQAWKGVMAAIEKGFNPVKVNVVLLKGSKENLESFTKLTLKLPIHIRFIELMDFLPNRDNLFLSGQEAKELILRGSSLEDVDSPKGSGPAHYFKLKGAQGTIGFIFPYTEHFCASCNRLRITADGHLRLCLFSDDEIDLKTPMRRGATDEEIEKIIREAIAGKPKNRWKAHRGKKGKKMSEIGG